MLLRRRRMHARLPVHEGAQAPRHASAKAHARLVLRLRQQRHYERHRHARPLLVGSGGGVQPHWRRRRRAHVLGGPHHGGGALPPGRGGALHAPPRGRAPRRLLRRRRSGRQRGAGAGRPPSRLGRRRAARALAGVAARGRARGRCLVLRRARPPLLGHRRLRRRGRLHGGEAELLLQIHGRHAHAPEHSRRLPGHRPRDRLVVRRLQALVGVLVLLLAHALLRQRRGR
mmetsp:Transcript_122230/g.342131  ORF Transcript_122230/g.342131 Transcript_122230/m.342131 type:complete len:229 (+) Transcript_122230:219-905(+)